MRIALITAHSPLAPAAGQRGLPRETPALARPLAELGHRVTIYSRRESTSCPDTAILGGGVSVEHIPAGPATRLTAEQAARHMPEFAAGLASRWRVRQPDVLHAFGWTSGLAGLGAARDTGIPVVQTFESLCSAERRQAAGSAVSACRMALEPSIGRAARAVLAWSGEEAAELARLAVPKSAIQVIPCGVDTALFTPDGPIATRSARARLIAFAPGGLSAGLETVIRALARLANAELVIVGGPGGGRLPRSGPFRELARLAGQLGVRNRITFAGEVPLNGLPALLRSADAMVSASPYEPSGAAAVQAMACGTPVVASAVGGQRDAVIDGTTGTLVAPGDAAMLVHRLRALLAAPALLQAYGIAAVDRARSRYSLDRIATETAAVYARCAPSASATGKAGRAEDDEVDVNQQPLAVFA